MEGKQKAVGYRKMPILRWFRFGDFLFHLAGMGEHCQMVKVKGSAY